MSFPSENVSQQNGLRALARKIGDMIRDRVRILYLLFPSQIRLKFCFFSCRRLSWLEIIGLTMLHDVGKKFYAGLNSSHHPTWCSNEANMLHLIMLDDVGPKHWLCWSRV